MSKEFDSIPEKLAQFATSQKLFFIASSTGNGDVNISPKGVVPIVVIDDRTVAYADYHGSGDQTSEHIMGGGKATLLFISFDKTPLIVRFFCTGEVISPGTDEFVGISNRYFSSLDSTQLRQIFVFNVYKVQRSCGFGVPEMEYLGDRSGQKYYRELLESEPDGGW
ncbi:MAG TPA: pyridoxamine 5'-phosphate oxidase family protein [Nitrospinota bacterium]|nr:pyridoxamine 5'-phosphate oxidase family protein [Nitrospinota bacterium]|tara:strand:+ start:37360 stop:37857 length:498 start_codon:yes stop_codon:yes gene_type:complete